MKAKPAIILLVLIFVGPIVLSWFFVNSDINWTERGLSNHGVLITPPLDLRDNEHTKAIFDHAKLAPSHWAIISFTTGACAEECRAGIDKLLDIHAVMGSSTDRTRVFGLAPSGKADAGQPLLVDSAAVGALEKLLRAQIPDIVFPQFLVVDWRQQLMLRFPNQAPPDDIKDDLSKLLRASKIR